MEKQYCKMKRSSREEEKFPLLSWRDFPLFIDQVLFLLFESPHKLIFLFLSVFIYFLLYQVLAAAHGLSSCLSIGVFLQGRQDPSSQPGIRPSLLPHKKEDSHWSRGPLGKSLL